MTFSNVGGSEIHQPTATGQLFMGKDLPEKPQADLGATIPIGGNDLSIMPGGMFGPEGNTEITVPKRMADDVNNRNLHVFVFGTANFLDVGGAAHKYCFAYIAAMKDGHTVGYIFRTGGPAYHCAT